MVLEPDILHDALASRCEAAEQAIEDLNVQCKFWRQATECAVDGWNALEEQYEDLQQRLRDLVQCPGPCLGPCAKNPCDVRDPGNR